MKKVPFRSRLILPTENKIPKQLKRFLFKLGEIDYHKTEQVEISLVVVLFKYDEEPVVGSRVKIPVGK